MTDRGRLILRSLTPRERQVLTLVCSGFPNRQIAQRLGTTEQVIKNYLRGVYRKSGARSRCGLVVLCFNNGVVACSLGQQSDKRLPDSLPVG